MRYVFAYDLHWSGVPPRYGAWVNVYQRYMRYRDRGDFARMLSAVQGQPGTAGLAEWLERVATKLPERS
jgi:hypothetical protein